MKKIKNIPENDLYIAILDDDPKHSFRADYFYYFGANYKQPLDDNIFVTDDIKKFLSFAENHRLAVLFCDPGALGSCMVHGEEFKEDNIMAKWLENNPGRVLHIPFLMPPDYYSFRTFELKHNVDFFGTEFQWEINQILYKHLFELNPLALFIDKFALDSAHDEYIKKLKEPILTQICERFGVYGRTAADRKRAINDYYTEVWKKEMKARCVKGY
jgi:hypothetical protein